MFWFLAFLLWTFVYKMVHSKHCLVKYLIPHMSLAFNSLANNRIPFLNLIKTSWLKQWQSKSVEASCESLCQTKGIWLDTANSLSLMAAAVPCYAVLLRNQPVEGTVALFEGSVVFSRWFHICSSGLNFKVMSWASHSNPTECEQDNSWKTIMMQCVICFLFSLQWVWTLLGQSLLHEGLHQVLSQVHFCVPCCLRSSSALLSKPWGSFGSNSSPGMSLGHQTLSKCFSGSVQDTIVIGKLWAIIGLFFLDPPLEILKIKLFHGRALFVSLLIFCEKHTNIWELPSGWGAKLDQSQMAWSNGSSALGQLR